VGYESPSQFSREYSRLFGAPPQRDVTRMRLAPVATASPRRAVSRSAARGASPRYRSPRPLAESRWAGAVARTCEKLAMKASRLDDFLSRTTLALKCLKASHVRRALGGLTQFRRPCVHIGNAGTREQAHEHRLWFPIASRAP